MVSKSSVCGQENNLQMDFPNRFLVLFFFATAFQQQQQQQQISSQQQQQQQVQPPQLQHHLQQLSYGNGVQQQQQQSPIQHAHHHQNHYGQQIIQNHTMAITIRNSVNPLDLQQQDVQQAMIQPHYLHTQPILQAHPLHHQFGTYPMERFEIKQEKN